jgi:hypothetical protein
MMISFLRDYAGYWRGKNSNWGIQNEGYYVIVRFHYPLFNRNYYLVVSFNGNYYLIVIRLLVL